MSGRRWVPWVVAGAAVAAAGAGTVWVGLETADEIGSVVGAVSGILGLALSVFGLLRARPAESRAPRLTEPPIEVAARSVASSISGSTLTGPVVQTGSVGGAVAAGTGNVVGDHNVVAESGGIIVEPGGQLFLPAAAPSAEPLPPPAVGLCVGRDTEVAEVVTAWTAGRSALVAGGPGIGKSTVLGRAITDRAVIESYGARRFVVSCDGAESAAAVVDKLAQALGVALGDHLRNRVLSFLREAPCVLVLDNFETPSDADAAGSAELVAEVRAGAPDTPVLGIGHRGSGGPPGVQGLTEIVLDPLPHGAAVEVFDELTGGRHQGDPAGDRLVAELDGVPLAITLLATLAPARAGLGTLVSAWHAKRTDLLHRGAGSDRTSSLPVSIELSWDRLGAEARTALSLAALLPDGWPDNRSDLYLPDDLAGGVIELSSRGLVHDDRARQRCLAPIRRHVAVHHPPGAAAMSQLITKVRALVSQAGGVGGAEGATAVEAVAPEFTNIVDVVRAELPQNPGLGSLVPGLLVFQVFTGLGDDQLAREALDSARTPLSRATVMFELGTLYRARGAHGPARSRLDQALPLFRRAGSVLGEANCLRGLGELEFRESNSDRARELYGQALPLYRRVGNVLGEANCLRNIGDLDFRESNSDRARDLYGQALPLYQRAGNALGEANCLRGLGELEIRESNNDRARQFFDQALPLYQRVGDLLGEANSLHSLGELEFIESDNDRAGELFDQALPLYRRVGDLLGEANCSHSLGRLEFLRSENDRARELFDHALPLFQRVGAVLGQANCLRDLGQLEFRESNNDRARELFGRALPLHRRVGSVLGEANCLRDLGELEFRESNNDRAREHFGRALPLYRRVGSVLGEANCMNNLGELKVLESDDDGARSLFERALPLYRRVGSVLGEANCLRSLGEVAFRESDDGGARSLFEQALLLYRRVGSVLGEANCLRSLGEVAFRESDDGGARSLFEQALPLYRRVGSVLGEANCLRDLGELAFRESDADRARNLFEEALLRYRRVGDRHSQALIHAWLARVTSGDRRFQHFDRISDLIPEPELGGMVEKLRRLAES